MTRTRPHRVEVKICGLTRAEDAAAAVAAGADYLGVVLSPGHRRSVDPREAATLRGDAVLPLVGVMVDESPARAAGLAEAAGVDIVQLHGDESAETLAALRDAGGWLVWKAIRPRSVVDLRRAAERWSGLADALLLDGWHPEKRGGSGTPFPWSVLEEGRPALPSHLRVVAAGGLTPYNVGEAVRRLAPDVVDVSSGVEARPGEKDATLIEAFVRAAREAASVGAGATQGREERG